MGQPAGLQAPSPGKPGEAWTPALEMTADVHGLLGTAAVHSEPEFSEQASQKYSDDVGGARLRSTIAPLGSCL